VLCIVVKTVDTPIWAYIFRVPINISNEINSFMSKNIALYVFRSFGDALIKWQKFPLKSHIHFSLFGGTQLKTGIVSHERNLATLLIFCWGYRRSIFRFTASSKWFRMCANLWLVLESSPGFGTILNQKEKRRTVFRSPFVFRFESAQ
jgi:hypothetical protein